MLPPHLIIVEEVLPEVRRRMALSLYSEGLSQEKISLLLGTSQAMVSRYLHQGGELHPDLENLVGKITMELTAAASAGDGQEELTDRFCIAVDSAIIQGMMDARYRSRFGKEPCRAYTGSHNERGRIELIDDLEKAVKYLRSHPIPDLIPALKVNIATGLSKASDINDIASYPGRLPDRNGLLTDPIPPQFGASRHLASVLLSAMRFDGFIRSLISLAFNDKVRTALMKMGLDPIELERETDTIQDLLAHKGPGKNCIVVDPGDFGIEPCLYLFGSTPLEISARAVEIQKRIGGHDE